MNMNGDVTIAFYVLRASTLLTYTNLNTMEIALIVYLTYVITFQKLRRGCLLLDTDRDRNSIFFFYDVLYYICLNGLKDRIMASYFQ